MRRRLSPDNPVRRCLFPSTGEDEGRNDNSINGTKEMLEREQQEFTKKWHYDFKNDIPLIGNGPVRWKHQEDGRLIGEIQNEDETDQMVNKAVENEPKSKDGEVEGMKIQNETTPQATPAKEAPPVRKRSKEDHCTPDSSAKRKIL